MNVQHSSRSDEWYTPAHIIERSRLVLGGIDLDPASCEHANKTVAAMRYYTRDDDGLRQPWFGGVFCNPPGGKIGNRSVTGLFWERLLEAVGNRTVKHAIFLCFSVEALQSTQRFARSVGDFPFCVPKRRIAFLPRPGFTATQPSHSNAIVYVPGTVNNTEAFAREFADAGKVIVPR